MAVGGVDDGERAGDRTSAADGDDTPSTGRRLLPRSVKRAVGLLLVALILQYVVFPQLSQAWAEVDVISQVEPLLLVAGALLQIGAYLANAQLFRAVLPGDDRPGLLAMTRITLASRAVSHVVPGGTAAGTALGFQLLRQRGVSGSDAGFAAATQGIGAALVLNVLLWGALVVSIPLRGFNPFYWAAAVLGVALLGGFAVLVLLLLKAEQRTGELVGRILEKVPFVERAAAERVVHRVADRLQELRRDPPLLRRAVGWAVVHWICDAASLWVFLAAFGTLMPADALFVAFGLANVLAAIPISPRGLGVVETVLVTSLVGFGAPSNAAVLGIAAYRLVNFWLPIPLGALAYLSLRVRVPGAPEEHPREVLATWVEDAAAHADNARDWAVRHGLRNPRSRPPK